MNYFENWQNVIKESKQSFLYESSLSKLLQHYEKDGFIILSADKDKNRGTVNAENRKKLKASLASLYKQYAIGYIPLKGDYVEVDPETHEQTKVEELSFLVVYKDTIPWDQFVSICVELRDRFEQDSILVSERNKTRTYYLYNPAVPEEDRIQAGFNKIILNPSTPYYSKLLKGSHSKAVWVFEGVPIHDSFSSRYMAYLNGEISHNWRA